MKNFRIERKILSGILGVAMAGIMPLSIASAEESTVEYTKGNTFTLNIPSSIETSDTEIKDATVAASEINVDPTKEVKITVSSTFIDSNYLKLLRENDVSGSEKTVKTAVTVEGGTMEGAQNVEEGSVVAVFRDQTQSAYSGGSLRFAAIEDADGDGVIESGTYKQTMTFTAETVERS